MAQLPDDLIWALGTVEIAGFLTSQLTNGLQSITLDQNRVTFPGKLFFPQGKRKAGKANAHAAPTGKN